MPNRTLQFPELVAIRGQEAARNDLGVTPFDPTSIQIQINSISNVNNIQTSQISSISGVNNIQTSNIQTISGSLATVSSNLSELSSDVTNISGNFTTDIFNMDISFTEAIFTHIHPDGTSPTISAHPFIWGRIDVISGGPLYVQMYR